MKRARIGIMAAAFFAASTLAFAQAKPDFSGTWTLDPEASTMGGGRQGGGGGGGGRAGGMMGGPMVVKHAGDTLTIERSMGENKVTTTYKLDGSESKNTVMMRGESMEQVAIAKWDGAKLVITTKNPNGDQVQTWSLEGATLSIERTGGRGAGKQVFKKS